MEEFLYVELNQLILIVFCLFLSAFFSASETAITSLGTLKTKHMIDSLGKSVSHLKLWIDYPGRVLTTILLFNNIVNILASSVVTQMATKYFESGAIGVATGITTFLVLFFGEIIPKSFAKAHAERLAVISMRFIVFVYFMSYPLVILLSSFADKVVSFFSHGTKTSPLITEEEIEFMVSEGEKAGVIEDIKKDIIEGAFDFDETKVKEIMTPRTDLIALNVSTNIEVAIEETIKTGYSRIPVFKESVDHIVGIIIAKDLLNYASQDKKDLKLSQIMREAFFAPESKSIMGVFKDLKRSKNHLAIIIDEYGGTAGIVTMEDILEEIVGDIQDEHDTEEAKILEIDKNIYEVSGSVTIDDFVDYFKLEDDISVQEERDRDLDTLAGLFTKFIEQMPEVGQKKQFAGLEIEVLEVNNKRIELFRVVKLDESKKNKEENKEDED